jgi:hypothetical protein
LRWQINGVPYRHSLDDLFRESLLRLEPSRLAGCGALTGHGDAHNANVWVEQRNGSSRLVLFDPAFAGEHMPALLADVKATFHNIFAHPLWLYDAPIADARFHVDVAIDNGRVIVDHDWASAAASASGFCAPRSISSGAAAAALRARDWLPGDWQRIVRCALFCCPTLVLNLRADAPHGAAGRSPAISALSFAIAVMAGSEPESGASDVFADFFAAIAPPCGA